MGCDELVLKVAIKALGFLKLFTNYRGDTMIRLLLILLLSTGAFSIHIRKAIGKRDKWMCQRKGCKRSFQTGYMVEAAHYDHNKEDPSYDTIEAGRILCIKHHADSHREGGNGLTDKQNEWAVLQISKKDSRTWWWRKKHG